LFQLFLELGVFSFESFQLRVLKIPNRIDKHENWVAMKNQAAKQSVVIKKGNDVEENPKKKTHTD
jgi:hypothetical protein